VPAIRVSDRIHERLRRDILEGRLAPGEAVPSERVLAEELGANRHAIREALKRLEQAGLVRISQGGATRVLDWRETAGIEVLLELIGRPSGTSAPRDIVRSVLEMRESVAVDAARRCAVRAPPAARAEIAALAEAAAAAIGSDDAVVDERYATMWTAVIAGADNVAYRLALTSLLGALAAYGEIADALRPADPARVRALGDALAVGDPDGAGVAALALLGGDAERFA
jgi:GntR family transcriptional repressor for pyruvate dehydrogenase complex